MLTCPMCKKTVRGKGKECPTCRTDLAILVDYLSDLDSSLARAEAKTRAGHLGEAVWAYLEVLEVDPDNPTARRQVGQVVTAVRQFDEVSYGRRWVDRLRRQARRRRWVEDLVDLTSTGWLTVAGAIVLAVVVLVAGFAWGYQAAQPQPEVEAPTPTTEKERPKLTSTDRTPLKGPRKTPPPLGK